MAVTPGMQNLIPSWTPQAVAGPVISLGTSRSELLQSTSWRLRMRAIATRTLMKQGRVTVLREAGMTLELWNNVVVASGMGDINNFLSITSTTLDVCKEFDE